MSLLILRSVAVYGAAAALALVLAHRCVLPLSRGAAAALALAPLLFTGRALLTGGVCAPLDNVYMAAPFAAHAAELGVGAPRSPILSDVVFLEIPWRAAARRAIFEGRLPLWNPSVLAGEPLLAVQQAAVLHPATWIGGLLPLPQAWTFEMTLRIFLALLCAYLFLRELRCGQIPSLLGALGWAFSDYLIFYLGFPQSIAAAPLPLFLLGLRRVARVPDRGAAAITVVAFLLVIAAGHPETLLHVVAAGAAWFAVELAFSARGHRGRSLATASVAGACALGLSAVLTAPLAEALPHTSEYRLRRDVFAHQPRAETPPRIRLHLASEVMPYAVGVRGRGQMPGFIDPTAYAGSLLLPFAAAGLFARRRVRWVFVGLGLAGLALGTGTAAADWLATLPFFDIALNQRLIFLTSLSLCALAALGADRLREGDGVPEFLAGAAAGIAILLWLFARLRPQRGALGMSEGYARGQLLLQILPLAAALVLVSIFLRVLRNGPRPGTATLVLVALVVVFAAQRVLEEGSVYPTIPARAFYPPLSVLSKIPRGDGYRIAGLRYALIPNAAALYSLEDVRGYEAMTLDPLRQTFSLWCVALPVWFNRVDDPSSPFLSFLGVRWMLTPLETAVPSGLAVIAESDGLRLLENPRALPRAFAPRRIRAEPDAVRRLDLLASVRDFAQQGVVEEGSSPGEWVDNGEARVRIAAYGPQALDLELEVAGEALVASSIPAWPGWRVRVDGRAVATVGYNHAFLAFRVPSGHHTATLRYLPEGFLLGGAITAASAAALLGYELYRLRAHRGRTRPRG